MYHTSNIKGKLSAMSDSHKDSGQQSRAPQNFARGLSLALPWPGQIWPELIASAKKKLPRGNAGQIFSHWFDLEIERRRLFNLLPVATGFGVLLYFSADQEPNLWAPLTVLAIAMALAIYKRHQPVLLAALLAVSAVMAGFSASVIRTKTVSTPVLERVRVGEMQGYIESVETRAGGSRLVILVTQIANLEPKDTPQRVRVTTTAKNLNAGEHISANARLLPRPEPARPGGYDFSRDAFFRGLGAVGSLNGTVRLSPAQVPMPLSLRFDSELDKARQALTARIVQAGGGGQAGAVAAALVTGKRGLISEDTNEALRAAGIYHIVSISGLHMVLAAGTIFWMVRALLALAGSTALRWPVKKIAALAAIIGASAYCIFSGSEVAAERSLLMTLVMLGAILFDRPALSMRNLAISALLILLKEPEQLMGPSFQMSFGAVALLIAGAETHRNATMDRRPPPEGLMKIVHTVWLSVVGLAVTTMLATIATTPFSLYHFHTLNPFGLLGNALAVPLVSLAVMPGAVMGVLLYPFGLDALPWYGIGAATQLVLAASGWVANFKGAAVIVPSFDHVALGFMAGALLWVSICTTPLRWIALVPACIGIAFAALPSRPDIFIARDGQGALVRTQGGELTVVGKPARFTLMQWLRAAGDSRQPDDTTLRQAQMCDPQGCSAVLKDGRTLSYARTVAALVEDCQRADIVITPLFWRSECRAILADRTRLAQTGAVTIAVNKGEWRYKFSRLEAGQRPWLKSSQSAQTGSAVPAYNAVNAPNRHTQPAATIPIPAQIADETERSDISDDLRIQ
jgi:competence protein ComEC